MFTKEEERMNNMSYLTPIFRKKAKGVGLLVWVLDFIGGIEMLFGGLVGYVFTQSIVLGIIIGIATGSVTIALAEILGHLRVIRYQTAGYKISKQLPIDYEMEIDDDDESED